MSNKTVKIIKQLASSFLIAHFKRHTPGEKAK